MTQTSAFHFESLVWDWPIAIYLFLIGISAGLALGDDGKVRALVAALGGGFWTWWFWLGVAGLGLIVPMLLKPWVNRSSGIPAVLAACGASLVGVLMLRFFILYAGQLTVA
ncbi:TPA: polysulfide reductase NrfD [Escherichia coli]|nr:polysulfide reductase NrfD [Escherichia coli]